MAAPALIREKSLRALPALVSSAYAAAVAGGHVIFSETELAVVRTGAGVPVCMSFFFFHLCRSFPFFASTFFGFAGEVFEDL